MLEPVYYYDAYINSRKIIYKTHRADLEHCDKIIHTYATGPNPLLLSTAGMALHYPRTF